MLRKKLIILSIVASTGVCSVAMAEDVGVNTAVGAVVGALIGHGIDRHHGAVIGGVLGAVVGASATNYNQGYYQGGYGAAPMYAPEPGYQPQPAYVSYYQSAPVYYREATVTYARGGYRGRPEYRYDRERADGRYERNRHGNSDSSFYRGH